MRHLIYRVHSSTRWVTNDASRTAATMLAILVTCSWSYALIEHKGPIEGLWWGIVTASTVGYGDYSPTTTAARFFGAVLIVSMWALTIAAAGHFTKRIMDDPDAWTHEEQEEIKQAIARTEAKVDRLLATRETIHLFDSTTPTERTP